MATHAKKPQVGTHEPRNAKLPCNVPVVGAVVVCGLSAVSYQYLPASSAGLFRSSPLPSGTDLLVRSPITWSSPELASLLGPESPGPCTDPTCPPPSAFLPLERDLGFRTPEEAAQIEGLIDVELELSALPVHCAVCRLASLEAYAMAARLALHPAPWQAAPCTQSPCQPPPRPKCMATEQAATMLRLPLAQLCPRLQQLGLLGTMARRAQPLRSVCMELAQSSWSKQVLVAASQFAANMSSAVCQSKPLPRPLGNSACDDLCSGSCPTGTSVSESMLGWAAVTESVLGAEPLQLVKLISEFPAGQEVGSPWHLGDPIAWFATAKSDPQALRLVLALSGASPEAVVQHGGHGAALPHGLGMRLAQLLTRPSITQQVRMLYRMEPAMFPACTASSGGDPCLKADGTPSMGLDMFAAST
eukprot:gene2656-3334_t